MSTVQTSTVERTGRNPWVAVALAMMAPGLGHIYAGEIVKGLVYFFGGLLFVPAVALAVLLPASWAVLAGLLLTVAAVLAIYLYSTIDAYRVARRRREQYSLRDYNRGLVYVMFLLASAAYIVGAVVFLRSNSLEAFYIQTDSMAPTIL